MNAAPVTAIRPPVKADDALVKLENAALAWCVKLPAQLDRADAPRRESWQTNEAATIWDWVCRLREAGDPVSCGDIALLVADEGTKARLRAIENTSPGLAGAAASVFAALEERRRKADALLAIDQARIALLGSEPTSNVVATLRDRMEPLADVASSALEPMSMEALVAPPKPAQFVAHELDLCVGRPALLVAPGYLGKTIVAQDIAVSIASGNRIFGQFHAVDGRVAWLDYEIGPDLLLERFRRLTRGRGMKWEDVAGKFRIASLPRAYLNTPHMERLLRKFVAGCVVCVIDSARRSLPGEDENDSRITEYLDVLTRVSLATACAFVLIHHASTKPQQGTTAKAAPRGSSAFFDCAGSVVVMSGEKGEAAKVTHEKAPTRGRTVEDFFLKIEDAAVDGDPRAGLRVRYMTPEQVNPPKAISAGFDAVKRNILAALRAEPMSKNRLAAKLGVRKTLVLEAVDELVERRILGEGKGVFYVL